MLFNFEGVCSQRKCSDYSEEDTPVPIPNTVVKLLSADDTWRVTSWEIRTSLLFLYGPMVKWLRHRPFTAVTRVRVPVGSPLRGESSDSLFFLSGACQRLRAQPFFQTLIRKGIPTSVHFTDKISIVHRTDKISLMHCADRISLELIRGLYADVVELADTQDLGSCA